MIRSVMFVPSVERMLMKIHSFNADAYVLDLEDAVSDDKKKDALKDAAAFLESMPEEKIYVRINRSLIENEIETLRSYKFEGYMLPKFVSPEEFSRFESELSRRNNIALTETPMGMANLRDIASCSWVSAIAFGAEDYTSSVMMKNSSEYLIGIKNMIVMFAMAFCKSAIDTPFMNLNDNEKFLSEVQMSADLGFDGKLAVHPKQTEAINNIFLRRSETDFMIEAVKLYEKNGGGAVSIGGKIYEKMHIENFKKILGIRIVITKR